MPLASATDYRDRIPDLEDLVEIEECRGNPLWGPWPDTPRSERAWFVGTPIGVPCFACGVPVAYGEFGEMMPLIDPDDPTIMPVHGECQLLAVAGHPFGVCSCTDYGGTGSIRAGALKLWEMVAADG
jgi:hypothetical protein